MIADARPPVIVRCLMAGTEREKRAFFSRKDARRARHPHQHTYRCPLCGNLHNTSRPAA